MVLAALAVLLTAGLALLVRGLIGKRIGSDPHCRKCKYNLTGLEADKCPECGIPATGRNIRRGLRRRRRVPLVVGSLLLLISLGGFGSAIYLRAKSVNWYAHLPRFALVQQAEGDDRRAIEELTTRLQDGTLWAESLRELVAIALRQQAMDPRPPSLSEWTAFLAAMDQAGGLAPQQRQQFREQMADFQFSHTPKVRQGERLMVSFQFRTRGAAGLPGSYRIEEGLLKIGDWAKPYDEVVNDAFANTGSEGVRGYAVATDDFAPGTYPVEFTATRQFLNPDFERPLRITSRLEVIPADAPSEVRLIDDPTLADRLREAISITASRIESPDNPDSAMVALVITVQGRIPVDCAFDLIALVDDREQPLGDLNIPRQESENHTSSHGRRYRRLDGVDSFVPILRSSTLVAEQSHNTAVLWDQRLHPITEIWNGELLLDPVPIERYEADITGDSDAGTKATTQPSQDDRG
jgi:hypothetical protein